MVDTLYIAQNSTSAFVLDHIISGATAQSNLCDLVHVKCVRLCITQKSNSQGDACHHTELVKSE